MSVSNFPDEHHYHELFHALKAYIPLVMTYDGLNPHLELEEGPHPMIHSNKSELMLNNGQPVHNETTLHALRLGHVH